MTRVTQGPVTLPQLGLLQNPTTAPYIVFLRLLLLSYSLSTVCLQPLFSYKLRAYTAAHPAQVVLQASRSSSSNTARPTIVCPPSRPLPIHFKGVGLVLSDPRFTAQTALTASPRFHHPNPTWIRGASLALVNSGPPAASSKREVHARRSEDSTRVGR